MAARPATGQTPIRYIRVPDDDWHDLALACTIAGTDRAKAIKEFIHWYLHRDGAELPTRPPKLPPAE